MASESEIEIVARALGANLASSDTQGSWCTTPGPELDHSKENDEGISPPIEGTWVMNFDGRIDLKELARAAIDALQRA